VSDLEEQTLTYLDPERKKRLFAKIVKIVAGLKFPFQHGHDGAREDL
jgi:hypothetical protein